MMSIKQEAEANSAMSDNMSAVSGVAPASLMDPIDSLLDLSEYDNAGQFNSPSMSPATTKNTFIRPTAASTPASMLSANQPMTAPSYQYDQYKQQTGFVPGALAATIAITQGSAQFAGYNSGLDMNFMNVNSSDDMFDFNTAPNNSSVSPSDIDLDFESPAADATLFFPDQQMSSVAPTATLAAGIVSGPESHGLQSPPDSQAAMGRLWPGMHQQAAVAKAQAQQRQQHQIIQQQQQRQRSGSVQKPMQQTPPTQAPAPRTKSGQPTDPIVEQKITQLLSTMRANPSSQGGVNGGMGSTSRSRKDEEDMDDDERLLASEEGKKLTSKERRQLRNKVSARAFRSRRKEYISQLESEIAGKVTENSDLRTQNRALLQENKRLSDLTRMLLGSPSFSDFLDRLSSNPSLVPQNQAQVAGQQAAAQTQDRQAPKDPNPYTAQQQIGIAMIPEQNIDFSMLQMDQEPAFAFQPQVYAVLDTPDVAVPTVDTSILSGKVSNFVGHYDEDEKIDMPVIEHPVTEKTFEAAQSVAPVTADAEFDSDPAFDLYHESPAAAVATSTTPSAAASKPVELNTDVFSDVDLFGGIETGKAAASPTDAASVSEESVQGVEEPLVLARIARIAHNLEAASLRLNMLNPEQ